MLEVGRSAPGDFGDDTVGRRAERLLSLVYGRGSIRGYVARNHDEPRFCAGLRPSERAQSRLACLRQGSTASLLAAPVPASGC